MLAADAALLRRLEEERQATAASLASLRRSFDDIVAASEDANLDDEHDPEGATVAFERQQVAALRDAAERHLEALDEAIRRTEAGEASTCEVCGQEVGAERLAALPATRRCVACAG
jgi:RNA polymerase-binding transcription factor DksA